MDNKTFKKLVKNKMKSAGYRASGSLFTVDCADGKGRVVICPPDTKRGFFIGVFFPSAAGDVRKFGDCPFQQFRFESRLVFPEFFGTTEEEIDAVCGEVFAYVDTLVKGGKDFIRDTFDEWVLTASDFDARNRYLELIGLAPVDPYSDAFRRNDFDTLKSGGMKTITIEEFFDHRAFYEGYLTIGRETGYSVRLDVDEKHGEVVLHFFGKV